MRHMTHTAIANTMISSSFMRLPSRARCDLFRCAKYICAVDRDGFDVAARDGSLERPVIEAELAPSLGNRQKTTVRVRICCHDQKLHRPGCAICGATKIHIRAERKAGGKLCEL